jgi:uncharacterized protein (TIGR03435 family)
MLQVLLADRFNLTFHREQRRLSVAALVVAPNGSKMRPSQAGPTDWQGIRLDPSQLIGQGAPMRRLVTILSPSTGQTVLDKTGLVETYDFSAEWAPTSGQLIPHQWYYDGPSQPVLSPAPGQNNSSCEDALQKQLGLVLEPRTLAVETIVIDSAEQPSET